MNELQALAVLEKSYAINLWMVRHSLRMVRGLRYTLGQRMQDSAMGLCLALTQARHAKRVDRPLARADTHLDELRLLVRMATDLGAMSERQHGYVSEHLADVGRQLGGWRRQLA
jgi:hypothetical protein